MTADDRPHPLLLAYRTLGLGDLLTAVPALRALALAFPSHRRVLATQAWLQPLVAWIPGRYQTLPAGELEMPVVAERPDVAVNLHGRGPESHRTLLRARPRRMIAFANEDVPWSGPRWNPREHERIRWCRLLSASGIDGDPDRLEILSPEPYAPSRAERAVIVHPGASAGARRWPEERWSALAATLVAAGYRIVVTGAPGERSLARGIGRAAGLRRPDVLAGSTDVADLATLVASADAVVSGDTGVSHLATALGTPSVTLFGPTSPETWGPPPDRMIHRAIWHGRAGDPHGDEPSDSLLAITVLEVLDAFHQVTSEPRLRLPGEPRDIPA
ncbi:MAG: glycosyltransferase family 9 protein [Actinomycetota bacterium]